VSTAPARRPALAHGGHCRVRASGVRPV
jgi:hypothetical protein